MSMTDLLTQRQVCQLLQVCPTTLKRLRKSRRIAFVQIGYRTIRFRREQVDRFIAKREAAVMDVREFIEKEAAL